MGIELLELMVAVWYSRLIGKSDAGSVVLIPLSDGDSLNHVGTPLNDALKYTVLWKRIESLASVPLLTPPGGS